MSAHIDQPEGGISADVRGAKSRFDSAYRRGMNALRDGDLNAFEAALAEQREATAALYAAIGPPWTLTGE
jgi:hypothetical protein